MIDGSYAIDYQVHSFCSHDGRASIDQQCARAIEIGLDEIGFSEHKDFDPADPVVEYFQYEEYMLQIEAARARYAGRLIIRAGVEIDYQADFERAISAYLDAHPFDFVIGSVHYVQREMIMTPEYNRTRTARTAYSDYFEAVLQSVVSGLFDIVGHLEYANRRGIAAWGPYNASAYHDSLGSIYQAMISAGVALEINTAGLHQNIGVTYPTAETVELYGRYGGTLLSIGSDAHHPDQLGWAYGAAVQTAREAGLTAVGTMESRMRVSVPFHPAGSQQAS